MNVSKLYITILHMRHVRIISYTKSTIKALKFIFLNDVVDDKDVLFIIIFSYVYVWLMYIKTDTVGI